MLAIPPPAKAGGTLARKLMDAEEVKLQRTLEKIRDRSLRSMAQEWLQRNIPLRRTSESFANQNPDLAITDIQIKLCYKLHKNGCTLRQIERIMHLKPAGGNNAYRCIKLYERKLLEARAARQKPVESTFAKAVLEVLTVPVEDRKEKLQQAMRMLDRLTA